MKMLPSLALNASVPALVADDVTILAAVAGVNVHLITTPFTPNPAYTFDAANEATFTGSAAKSNDPGNQNNFRDPTTGDLVVQLREPAGGWTWICVSAAPTTPQTVVGICVTNNANNQTYGCGLFPSPITITSIGDAVDLDSVELRLAPGFMG